ncbi:MAG: hypothetical protein ACR2OU_03380 [Thermomicrobiales bacterium]
MPLTSYPNTGVTDPAIGPSASERLELDALMLLQSMRLPSVPTRKRLAPTIALALTGERGDCITLLCEIERVTGRRQDDPERAIGLCPFHGDRHRSLSKQGGF